MASGVASPIPTLPEVSITRPVFEPVVIWRGLRVPVPPWVVLITNLLFPES